MVRYSFVLLGLAACSSSGGTATPDSPTSCPGTEVVAAASDYTSSVVCGAPPCQLGPRTSGVGLGKDPLLTSSNGRLFYIVRDMDAAYELDPACGTAIKPLDLRQPDTTLANVHDIAAAKDGTLFAALYDVPRIVVLGADGKQQLAIDISMYDMDGNPQADSIAITEVNGVEKAFVTLEMLDNSPAAIAGGASTYLRSNQPSMMLRIDVATRRVDGEVALAGRNPFNTIRELAGTYFLAEPGNFDVADEPLAGIERFDTATSTTKLLVTEKDLGGSVSEVAVTDGCGAALVAGPQKDVNPTSLVTFDPATGAVLTTAAAPVLATSGFDLQGLTWSGDTLYVGDRRGEAPYSIHVYTRDPGTCILHDSGRAVTLPQKPVAFRPAR